jgi:hypothetical protein
MHRGKFKILLCVLRVRVSVFASSRFNRFSYLPVIASIAKQSPATKRLLHSVRNDKRIVPDENFVYIY